MLCNPLNIVIDVRCLQDPFIRHRGIGQHSYSLLSNLRESTVARKVNMFAFLDNNLPPLDKTYSSLFRGFCSDLSRLSGQVDIFVNPSPMTHRVYPLRWILNDRKIFKVALAYDLIPMMQPETYLASITERCQYLACCATLRRYDKIAAISRFAARQLEQSLSIPAQDMFVTGCAVRTSLLNVGISYDAGRGERYRILIAGGEDLRKNSECALRAHAASRYFQENRVPVVVTGNYTDAKRKTLLNIVEAYGGSKDLVTFANHLEDCELGNLYREAVLTVIPSFLEGFSLPVVEGAANGSVVLASQTSAHPELISDECCLFNPHEHRDLTGKMELLVKDISLWQKVQSTQYQLKDRFSADRVGDRFWGEVLSPYSPAIKNVQETIGGRVRY